MSGTARPTATKCMQNAKKWSSVGCQISKTVHPIASTFPRPVSRWGVSALPTRNYAGTLLGPSSRTSNPPHCRIWILYRSVARTWACGRYSYIAQRSSAADAVLNVRWPVVLLCTSSILLCGRACNLSCFVLFLININEFVLFWRLHGLRREDGYCLSTREAESRHLVRLVIRCFCLKSLHLETLTVGFDFPHEVSYWCYIVL